MGKVEVTLVVPLRDEEGAVASLVGSIAGQTRAPEAVILVDAGSLDRTGALLEAACRGRPGWTVLDGGPATPGKARNLGIAAAETEWVALTDAGCELDRYWLERLVRVASAEEDVEMVFGHYEPVQDSWFTACSVLAYVDPPKLQPVGPVRMPSVASCLLRRSLWERAGQFPDLRAGEDGVFLRRVAELEARTAVAPEAVMWWHLAPGFAATFRRFQRYSEVNVRAGEQRYWHRGVARMYLLALPFVLAALWRPGWAVVPLAGALVRVERGIWRRREGRGVLWATHPARVATVAAVVATVDAATIAGWLQAADVPFAGAGWR